MNVQTDSLKLSARILSQHELTPRLIDSWRKLAQHSVEANPFLQSEFVLTQAKFLNSQEEFSLWVVQDQHEELQLLSVITPITASSRIPFPHLQSQNSVYQFQGGVLLSQHRPRQTMVTFLEHLKRTRFRHGLVLNTMCIDSALAEQLYTSAVLTGYIPQLQNTWSRACLDLQQLDRDRLIESCFSKNRRKSLRKAHSKLQQSGAVSFRVLSSREQIPEAVERFLKLEQSGWKASAGTAIACNSSDRQFFETMSQEMAVNNQIMFGELLINDQVIASTCNLIAGDTLFAFKIGWDENYRDGSPGLWAEVELADHVAKHCPQIHFLNSCSVAGSYLDQLWPHRIPMGNVVLFQSHRAILYSGVRKTLRSATKLFWPNGDAKKAD